MSCLAKEGVVCTLVTLYGINDRYPLIVLANRDEKLGRPSTVPRVLHQNTQGSLRTRSLAPLDIPSGSTWIGLSARGFFAAVTNQDSDTIDPQAKSRGKVVSEVLRLQGVYEASDYLKSLNPEQYNPFNLVFGSVYNMRLARVHRGRPVSIETMNPGIAVTSNDQSETGAYAVKCKRAADLAASIQDREPLNGILQKAAYILGYHENGEVGPHQSICVHSGEFGTRSTSVLLIPRYAEDNPRLFHSEGPTCKSEGFAEYSYLFEE